MSQPMPAIDPIPLAPALAAKRLIMIVPAPAHRLADGRLRLEVKFVEGMRLHLAHWPGPITVVMEEGGAIPFGEDYDPAVLGFDLYLRSPGSAHSVEALAPVLVDAAGVYASADMYDVFGNWPVPVVYSLEYTIGTRLRIVGLDRSRPLLRRLWSGLWNLRIEQKRRAALRRAVGLQCNSYPAMAVYSGLNRNSLIYHDGRMRQAMMAGPEVMLQKAQWSGPLRLVHSGRLEPMKGAQDILPVARALQVAGVAFTLDIFGTGSLESELKAALGDFNGAVRLHAPVDFETVLVPWMRENADIFLSCHRQADPSCSYIEAMGCGAPVMGYANGMWGHMARESGGGWVVPMGDQLALARELVNLAQNRAVIVTAAKAGLAFAQAHDFDAEFASRMQHLQRCLAQGRAWE